MPSYRFTSLFAFFNQLTSLFAIINNVVSNPLSQVVVEKHVRGQAESEGLTEVEAVQLQIDTLQHNGLPLPEDLLNKIKAATSSSAPASLPASLATPSTNVLGDILGSAQGIVGSIFSDEPSPVGHNPDNDHTDLPQQVLGVGDSKSCPRALWSTLSC